MVKLKYVRKKDSECEAFPDFLPPGDWLGILQHQILQPLILALDQHCPGQLCESGGEPPCCPCERNTGDTLDKCNP